MPPLSESNLTKILVTAPNNNEGPSHASTYPPPSEGIPISPSDASSPSLDEDSDSDEASDSDSDGPSLQMMGETHMRLKNMKVKDSQGQLGLPIPTVTRARMVSDPMGRLRDGESRTASPQPVQSLPSEPVEIPWSPAMAFLAGFNSPVNVPCSLPPAIEVVTPAAPTVSAAPAEERVGAYILGPVIAHGGFSVIRKGTSPSGVVAVKIIHKSRQQTKEELAALENEILIWSSLHHEYILPLFSTYRTDDAIHLVSLYCPAGSLFDILRLHGSPGLPQDDVGTMFRQIVRGLRYLHEQILLIHGDIKLENVLVDELGACRITDFGLAQYISDEPRDHEEEEVPRLMVPPHLRGRAAHHRNSTHVPGVTTPLSLHNFPAGSLPYAAPELLLPPTTPKGQAEHRPYRPHPAQDIWALGCLLHALLFGRLPFMDTYEPRLQMKIVRGVWERERSRTRSRARGSSSRSRPRSRARSPSRDGRSPMKLPHRGAPMRRSSKSRSNDMKIGKGARKVLRGCICVEVGKRWTISQIDEVSIPPLLSGCIAPCRN